MSKKIKSANINNEFDNINYINIIGATQNNLKNINTQIPKNKLVIFTGPSGSGKSSLVMSVINNEAKRRYVESLSTYARQFLEIQDKAEVEYIGGLSPSVSIEQKTISKNPRSTVGTITEIYDYLRLLFARIGVVYSPATGLPIKGQSPSQIIEIIGKMPQGIEVDIMARIAHHKKGEFKHEFAELKKKGYSKFNIDGKLYDDELPNLAKSKFHDIYVVIDALKISDNLGSRLAEAVETALGLGGGILFVQTTNIPDDENINKEKYKIGNLDFYSEHFLCPESGLQIGKIEPRMFSFNSPKGACSACNGLGREEYLNENLLIQDENKSINEGAIEAFLEHNYRQVLPYVAKHKDFSLDTPFKDLPADVKDYLFHARTKFIVHDNKKKFEVTFKGIVAASTSSFSMFLGEVDMGAIPSALRDIRRCSVCEGYRLNKEALSVLVDKKNIGNICDFNISEANEWINSLVNKLDEYDLQIANRIIKEISNRLVFLQNVGVEYLTLARESETLSGGESQRIRLASQIGSGLTGVIYVLDEPSIGLHQSDNSKLISTLKYLRDIGNSVLVIEHDEETMLESDYIFDFGPNSGKFGGEIVSHGTPKDLIKNAISLTGKYLAGTEKIAIPAERRIPDPKKEIIIKGARINNLKNIDVRIPLGVLTCICGVSGGGKSSIMNHTLCANINKIVGNPKVLGAHFDYIAGGHFIDKIIQIDQSPIGRTPRSNAVTYTGIFDLIRAFYADLPDSKARGYKIGRFSFNVKGGRCEKCQGDGMIKIEMHFLPDVYVNCSECNGSRYNKETNEIKYKGYSISNVLGMSVDEAIVFFDKIINIKEKLKSLSDVGLGYISLGHSATMLSGGEAQRIKLAKELSKRSTGSTLYVLDEPTTGLHTDDVKKLLQILQKFVDAGNSVIVIEHNLDVLKTADHLIDIGPKGGTLGGYIVAEGTPEEVAKNKKSVTGPYLREKLRS